MTMFDHAIGIDDDSSHSALPFSGKQHSTGSAINTGRRLSIRVNAIANSLHRFLNSAILRLPPDDPVAINSLGEGVARLFLLLYCVNSGWVSKMTFAVLRSTSPKRGVLCNDRRAS
jgi:hypothetical protein